jgi:hypothetical protein
MNASRAVGKGSSRMMRDEEVAERPANAVPSTSHRLLLTLRSQPFGGSLPISTSSLMSTSSLDEIRRD